MSDRFTADMRRDVIYTPIESEFVRWLYINLDLVPKKFKQRILDMDNTVVDYPQPDTLSYVNRAHDEYNDAGSVEVDSCALVSKGADDGAYVMAWVWVQDEIPDPELGDEDHE